MKFKNYNFNYSPYDNVKSNILADKMAKNKWGSKFKKLYNPLKNSLNQVDFTQGMLNCAGTDVFGIIEELENLRDGLNSFFTLSDNNNARANSYFTLLCSSAFDDYSETYAVMEDVKLSLSLPITINNSDARRISKFFQKGSSITDSTAYLEPVDSYFKRIEESTSIEKPFYSRNQLSLNIADGTAYGHIESTFILALGSNFSTVHALYGVEESHSFFLNNYDYNSKFNELFANFKLSDWLLKFVRYSYTWQHHEPPLGQSVAIVFGADLILAWLDENLAAWYAYMNDLNAERGGVELELISHLNMCDMLQEQIEGHAGDISSIWFEFKKNVSPPLVGEGWETDYQPNYQWWNEEQFDEIRKKFKNFHLFCDYHVGSYDWSGEGGGGTLSYVTLKDEAFSLVGWKIYWLVTALLNIDSRNKSRSFLERLFTIVLLVVAIYLTAVSGNPGWLKMVLIVVSLANFAGALSPKAQLLVAMVSFAYGLSTTNISAMTGTQFLGWAVNNIEMVLKMVQIYDKIKVEDELKEESEEEALMPHEEQERTMNFIYSDGYSQYDNLYSVLYSYEVKYK